MGAQAVGYDGVDKRIDDIATVIRFKGTVTDLTELELSYAPPYSSAKDPVNMAGYTAENVINGMTEVFVPGDLAGRNLDSTMLVDVRSELEHANGHIEGSINLPVDELRNRLDELDPSKEIWVYCQVGLRGYTASRILLQKGFNVKNLTGGYKTYQISKYVPQNKNTASNEKLSVADNLNADAVIDACGLCCPGPIVQVKKSIDRLQDGQLLKVTASDQGFFEDIKSWAKLSRNSLVQLTKLADGTIEAYLRKGNINDASISKS